MINRYTGRLGGIEHTNPKNGHQRVVEDRDSIKHLEVFFNGRWIHDSKCKELTNKECNKIKR
jgi:hypothetical protein